jgi:tetratricopeptide (TPR) repeat protein
MPRAASDASSQKLKQLLPASIFTSVDFEKAINEAIDLMADARDAEAESCLLAFIGDLKSGMNASAADAECYYYWGRSLGLLEEPEQALLRFEQALQIRPDYEDAWWETAVILLHELDRPEGAKTILEEHLLSKHPGHPLYQDALAAAETYIRRRPPSTELGNQAQGPEDEFPGDNAPSPE